MAYELTEEDKAYLAEADRKIDNGETYEALYKAGKVSPGYGILGHVKWVPSNLRPGCYWPGGKAKNSSAHVDISGTREKVKEREKKIAAVKATQPTSA